MPDGTATAHHYWPKLATVVAEGYGLDAFRKDTLAALTVAIVALPLSMAIAVASGVSPERGLYTAIVGGFIVSVLGGSRYQIGGPAGAFIVLVAATGTQFGLSGLLLTVLMSGVFLTLIGLARLGALIRYMPHPVTIGFTCAIAATILASQLKELGGLTLVGPEPGHFFPKIAALAATLPTISLPAVSIGIGSATMIFVLRALKPNWPGMLIAVVLSSLAAFVFHLPVETIGSRFGGIPQNFPTPELPPISLSLILQVLPAALTFTLLGGVESLLSAKVADAMTGRKHRYNMELVAQGIANIASALFGGISVTGTIARTATNIRAGAKSPLSGMMHCGFLLLFMFAAAPLARFVPLAALGGVLVVVAYNMAELRDFGRLLRDWRGAAILLATFGLTLLEDLTFGIVAGCGLAIGFAAFDWLKSKALKARD
jgi:SulP family sulfate permease